MFSWNIGISFVLELKHSRQQLLKSTSKVIGSMICLVKCTFFTILHFFFSAFSLRSETFSVAIRNFALNLNF